MWNTYETISLKFYIWGRLKKVYKTQDLLKLRVKPKNFNIFNTYEINSF